MELAGTFPAYSVSMLATTQRQRITAASTAAQEVGTRQPALGGARPTRVLVATTDAAVEHTLRQGAARPATPLEMTVVASVAESVAALAMVSYDAVFADLETDAAGALTLLSEAEVRQPASLRVAIGDPHGEAAARAIHVSHRLLGKPLDADTVEIFTAHAAALRARMQDERIRLLVGGVSSLPSVPRLYAALTRLLHSDDVSIDAVTRQVAEDPGIAAKILQLANSPMFGIAREVTTLRSAVALLGVRAIHSLVLSAELVRAFPAGGPGDSATLEALQSHAVAVASLATRLLPDRLDPDEVFAAAVLHDVGKLVLLDRCTEMYDYLSRSSTGRRVPLHRLELEVLGITHAEIGAYLLHLWQLPESIVAGVASHHIPSRPTATELSAVIHVADALVHGLHSPEREAARLDADCLEHLGLADRLPAWRQLAARRLGAPA
jgi:putative nucleotidyltransferase with HDIG domain